MTPNCLVFSKNGRRLFVAVKNPSNMYNLVAGKEIVKKNMSNKKLLELIQNKDLRVSVSHGFNKLELVGFLASCGDNLYPLDFIANRFNMTEKEMRTKIKYLYSRGYELPYNIKGCQL